MQLSPNFSLQELTHSDTAVRLKRAVIAEPFIIENLTALCVEVLEPIRQFAGRPISVISGYRPDWLNKLIGGSRTSDHMLGLAADIRCRELSPTQLAAQVEMLAPQLPLKQLILEFPPSGWVHVSIARPPQTPKREILTALSKGRDTIYFRGLDWEKNA